MHARADWGPQYLYLSTPEIQPFDVSVRDGAGNLVTTATISNSQPFSFSLGSTDDTKTLVPENLLQQVLTDRGLVLDGPKRFYAYFRAHANNQYQAGDLTCKGRAALGKIFRIGHLDQRTIDNSDRANFVGVMASEDSTEIVLSDYDPKTDFRINGGDVEQPNPIKMTLNRGESAVFSMYIGDNDAQTPPNGFMGMLVKSTKPIAINCGSWKGAPVSFAANDIGIDQIAPLEQVGDEYILCRGNGSDVLEHPIVVAHFDGTDVFLNGSASPTITLAAGGFFVVPTSAFSAGGNMHIRASHPVFMYQMIGGIDSGDDQNRTAGLIFVPPISCAIPNTVDNIYLPNTIGNMRFDGGVMLVAMKDSAVTVFVDGQIKPIGAPSAVAGSPDFVTYRSLAIFSQNDNPKTIKVVAQGAIQVALFGRNNPASFAAFFSGFSKSVLKPKLTLKMIGDGVCPDTLVASGRFDGVQWMYEDSLLQYGADTIFIAYAPGNYIARGYLGVCRRTDFAADTIAAAFNSPAFPFFIEEPSCYGFADGQIKFGQPTGGLEPYSFSVDNGKTFSQNNQIKNLSAGAYTLVARDSTGCYNRPLKTEIGQPDSFGVKIEAVRLPVPLFPGNLVELKGVPDRPVVQAFWSPIDSIPCSEEPCLEYKISPIEGIYVDLMVIDSNGCPAKDRIFLEVTPNIFAPNAFRPNSNDNYSFTLFSRENVPIRHLQIFDRWGTAVFDKKNSLVNDLSAGWDGTFRGKNCLPGVYTWWAEVERVPGDVVFLKGDLTLIR
jgi:gliding motility-associated-like protein